MFKKLLTASLLLLFPDEAGASDDIAALQAQLAATPTATALKVQLIADYVITQQYELALQPLITVMESEPHYQQNYPQLAMLRIIKLLGHDHPLIGQYRAQIQRYAH